MTIEDIKKISPLDKNKFYLFRLGIGQYQLAEIKNMRKELEKCGIKALIIIADDLDVIELDEGTYKLVKNEK